MLCWKPDTVTEQVKDFIRDSIGLGISPKVIEHCINYGKVKAPGAIIAVTALALGYSLIINNEKDFNNIKGLKVNNPQRFE